MRISKKAIIIASISTFAIGSLTSIGYAAWIQYRGFSSETIDRHMYNVEFKENPSSDTVILKYNDLELTSTFELPEVTDELSVGWSPKTDPEDYFAGIYYTGTHVLSEFKDDIVDYKLTMYRVLQSQVPQTYTVRFLSNGPTGTMSNQIVVERDTFIIPTPTFVTTYTTFAFTGWTINDVGYSVSQEVTASEELVTSIEAGVKYIDVYAQYDDKVAINFVKTKTSSGVTVFNLSSGYLDGSSLVAFNNRITIPGRNKYTFDTRFDFNNILVDSEQHELPLGSSDSEVILGKKDNNYIILNNIQYKIDYDSNGLNPIVNFTPTWGNIPQITVKFLIDGTSYVYKNKFVSPERNTFNSGTVITLPDSSSLTSNLGISKSGYTLMDYTYEESTKEIGETITLPNIDGMVVYITANYIKDVTGALIYYSATAGQEGSTSTTSIRSPSGAEMTFYLTGKASGGSGPVANYYWSFSSNSANATINGNSTYLSQTPEQITIYVPARTSGGTSKSVLILTITGESGATTSATFTIEAYKECVIPETLITMADGSKKMVKDIAAGDMVKVFNHETGEYDVAPMTFNDYDPAALVTVINLEFSNGSKVGVVSEHGFFDLDTMRYEYIREDNYQCFVGHRFYVDGGSSATLDRVTLEERYTEVYSPTSFFHFDYFVEDMLSMPGGITGLFNIFEYADNLQYDQEKYYQDIETYGLFTYDDLAPLGVTEIMFEAYAGKYLKVALGKGILTEEYLMYLIERYGGFTENE